MCIILSEIHQKVMIIDFVNRLLERDRRVQVEFCRQRGATILNGIGLVIAMNEKLLEIRCLSSNNLLLHTVIHVISKYYASVFDTTQESTKLSCFPLS